MKIVQADWEKRNLGVDTVELEFDAKDAVGEVEACLQGIAAEYVVAKAPANRTDVGTLLEKHGYRFAETMVKLVNTFPPVQKTAVEKRLDDAVSVAPMDASGFDRAFAEIRQGMFSTDRISRDPYFTKEQAAERYINWILDEKKRGTEFFQYVYKGEPIAFTTLREVEPGVYTSFLGGFYKKYRTGGMASAVDKTVTVARERHAKSMFIYVSGSNLAQVKAEMRHGYVIDQMFSVYTKHQDVADAPAAEKKQRPAAPKNAIVTGANRGIGRAVVEKFAAEGCNIWACARKPSPAFEEDMRSVAGRYGVWVKPVYFDLTSEAEIREGFKQIYAEKLPIDVLVNNAGVVSLEMFQRYSMERVREIYQINVFSVMYLCQLVMKAMVRNKSGSIVNISSVSAVSPSFTISVYGSAKAAINAFSQSLAVEAGPYNIRVNAVSPGSTGDHGGQDVRDYDIARTALGRLTSPEELANVVYFVASDEASYISGEIIRVDGGRM